MLLGNSDEKKCRSFYQVVSATKVINMDKIKITSWNKAQEQWWSRMENICCYTTKQVTGILRKGTLRKERLHKQMRFEKLKKKRGLMRGFCPTLKSGLSSFSKERASSSRKRSPCL